MRKPAENANGGAGLVARVVSGFKGVRDGEVYPVQFAPGDKITGALAAAAIEMNCAEAIGKPLETKETAKDQSGPFSTGPAKPSQSPQAGPASKKRTSKKSKANPDS